MLLSHSTTPLTLLPLLLPCPLHLWHLSTAICSLAISNAIIPTEVTEPISETASSVPHHPEGDQNMPPKNIPL